MSRVSKTEVGTVWSSEKNGDFEIIEKLKGSKRRIKFLSEPYYESIVYASNIVEGTVNNPFARKHMGIGFIGSGEHSPNTHKKAYKIWSAMLRRCYNADKNFRLKNRVYDNCTVHTDWHNFQNFSEWCEKQKGFNSTDFNLDKDILGLQNPEYSPSTCCFVPAELNVAYSTNVKSIGKKLPTGITLVGTKYVVQISRRGCNIKILRSSCLEEALMAYRQAREVYIRELAEFWKADISRDVYIVLSNYKEGLYNEYPNVPR